jgi:uncharacterized protein YjbJ (UPF0337 family)
MAINQEVIEGHWNEVKGKVRERWGRFAGDELDQARGNVDQLIALIERETGEARDAVESYLEDATRAGTSTASRVADSVKTNAHRATEAVEHAAVDAAKSVRAGYSQAEEAVRRHPLESLAIFFGLGLLVGIVTSIFVRSR